MMKAYYKLLLTVVWQNIHTYYLQRVNMKTVATIITNLFELVGMLFVLAIVTSIVLSIDIMGPTLDWINGNLVVALGIVITYILYKSESNL